MYHFYTLWKYKRTRSIMMFSGSIQIEHWLEICWHNYYCWQDYHSQIGHVSALSYCLYSSLLCSAKTQYFFDKLQKGTTQKSYWEQLLIYPYLIRNQSEFGHIISNMDGIVEVTEFRCNMIQIKTQLRSYLGIRVRKHIWRWASMWPKLLMSFKKNRLLRFI